GNADAEDVTQRAFVRVYEGRHLFRGGDLTAWMATIAFREGAGTFRRDGRQAHGHQAPLSDEQRQWALERPSRELLPHESGVAWAEPLEKTLRDLGISAPHVEILLLSNADMPYEEMAVYLDVPIGTIMSRLHRARASAKKAILARAHLSGGGADTPDGWAALL